MIVPLLRFHWKVGSAPAPKFAGTTRGNARVRSTFVIRNADKCREAQEVVRCALQDKSTIAGLLITTEAMVAERPKKETRHPPMPAGGMGGMDY
jgi:chaperonin GroEL